MKHTADKCSLNLCYCFFLSLNGYKTQTITFLHTTQVLLKDINQTKGGAQKLPCSQQSSDSMTAHDGDEETLLHLEVF